MGGEKLFVVTFCVFPPLGLWSWWWVRRRRRRRVIKIVVMVVVVDDNNSDDDVGGGGGEWRRDGEGQNEGSGGRG